MDTRDLLVELGTEELPPRALPALRAAFERALRERVDRAGLAGRAWRSFATPRRLAVLGEALPVAQSGRESLRRGPALNAAFDAEGRPTRAAEGFAASCGVGVEALQRLQTDKGAWLVHRVVEAGRPSLEVLPEIIAEAILALPVPKRMRWGSSEAEFVRPAHWLVALFGQDVVEARVLEVQAGRETRGHRFHHPGPIPLHSPADYLPALEQAHVLADFERRRALIREGVSALAVAGGGQAVIDEALLEEVTSLVEWPVCIEGGFEPEFLELPPEVLIATMRDHQRYFHLQDAEGRLLNRFITVANIASRDPAAVRAGNERVIRPRLTDARFFWRQDARVPLADRLAGLGEMVFQQRLGSLLDKTLRVAAGAREVAEAIGADPHLAERAALLSRCDLSTAMVGEFPELQGIMGRHYALREGEPPEVAEALEDFYAPRHAGDRLPRGAVARALAIADRLDTLVGIFGIGQAPTGDKDPFALRRTALGVLRLLIEQAIDLDLEPFLVRAGERLAGRVEGAELTAQVFDFMMERLRAYYAEAGVAATSFEAVLARRPTRPYDFHRRLLAVQAFRALPAAEALASANKRIGNILRKAEEAPAERLATERLEVPAERELAAAVQAAEIAVAPLLAARDYEAALQRLAELRPSVDAFFDTVMVMCEQADLRRNRLALLAAVQGLFLRVADVARLQA